MLPGSKDLIMNRFLKLFGKSVRACPKSQKKAAPRARLALEALEERWMPSAVRDLAGFALATLAPTDDGSTGAVALGFKDAQGNPEKINFFGQRYDQLYVNNNGNVTFDRPQDTYTPYTISTNRAKIIAPFFADVDTRGAGQPVKYGTGSLLTDESHGIINGHQVFAVNWLRVNYYDATSDAVDHPHKDLLNSFQLLLINRDDTGAGNFDIEFNYDAINWETGDASSGHDGVGGDPGTSAHVGFSNGVDTAKELPGSGIAGAFLDTSSTGLIHNDNGSRMLGRYVFAARDGTIKHFEVDPGIDAQGSVIAGNEDLLTVTAKDINDHDVNGYTGTIHFTSSDPQAVLPADYTFVAGDHGRQVFHVTLRTAGRQTITVTDAQGIVGIGQLQIDPAAASQLTVSGFPSPATAGTAGTFTVTAKDPYGNVAAGGNDSTNYTGTIHFTSSDRLAVLPADYTFAIGDHGVHTVNATLNTTGLQSITATDPHLAPGVQANIQVNAGAATFVVAGFPTPTTAGDSHAFTVTVQDAAGHPLVGSTGTIHFTSSDPQAVLPADYTFGIGDHGVHTFNATLKTAGRQSLTATDQATGSNGTQTGILVNPADASTLVVTGFPSPTTAGDAHEFTVTARDAYGNVATNFVGTVHFTSGDNKAVLPGSYTFTGRGGDEGVNLFRATLVTAGNQWIMADAGAGVTGTQIPIAVNPADASRLVVTGFPSPTPAGQAGAFTVLAKDRYGNTDSNYRGAIHFSSNDPRAVLPPDYNFVQGDHGVHTFQATLNTPGSRSLTATDLSGGFGPTDGTQAGIQVLAALVATHFRVTAPTTATAGTAFSVTVTALDQLNNLVPYIGRVHFTSSDPAASLPNDYTFTAGDVGQHTFRMTLRTAGARTITVTDTTTSLLTGSESVSVSQAPPAAPTGLKWTPTSGYDGSLSWSPVAGADGYDIYYWNPNDGRWVFLYRARANETSVSIHNGYGYYFSVGAYNAAGENFSAPFLAV
jgi:hypothetical protein